MACYAASLIAGYICDRCGKTAGATNKPDFCPHCRAVFGRDAEVAVVTMTVTGDKGLGISIDVSLADEPPSLTD